MNETTIHHIWYPLRDQPVTVEMSREQLQIIQDVLRGNTRSSKPGWRESLAAQIERVLVSSVNTDGSAPEET